MVDPQQTESIKSLVEGIDKGTLVLPEFQRDFVWEIGKTYDLFDSLVRDIFIGSIIYGKPSFEITVREIDKRPRKGNGSRAKLKISFFSKEEIEKKSQINNFRLVLDGQQRVTSIYRALKGIDEIWMIIKNDEELNELVQQKEFKDRSLEEMIFEFNGNEDENRLSIKLSDAYAIAKEGLFEDEIKQNYFNNLSFIAGMDDNEIKETFRRYIILSKKLNDLFASEKLLSYYLLNMSTDKFALFFERSNSRGIQLNFIDILAAKLYKGFNLREKIEEFENNNKGSEFTLNREIIVRAIAYIVSDGKEVDKTYILSQLNYQHFNDYWDEVCRMYVSTLDFLYKGNYILSQSWMPYENMLIPLMMFLRELHGKDYSQMTEKQLEFIKYWYWASIFSQRYSSGSNEVIVQDSTILRAIAQNRKINDRTYFTRLKNQVQSFEDILSFSKKGSAIYKGILNLMNFAAEGFVDWNNTSKLSANSKLEDHHIFPVEYIKTRSTFKDDEQSLSLIDCIANRTLIPKLTNIRIGKRAPSEYLRDLKAINPMLDSSLTNHFIPLDILDGLYDDFYIEFLETRAKSIFSLVQSNIISKEKYIIDEFYQAPAIKGSGNIKIFCVYYNKRVDATFDIETQKVFYAGGNYSVSSAADQVKADLTGKKNTSTNGWRFWRYVDDIGQERYLDDFRKKADT
ncbi:GmrSD restriction endonuclease domain-containing protein [Paenibacillus naphthalenovorans]|uniref:GmrSD restriction endonuclease domain-containing protein n=1 Tax=Paenibacillus naphthalenovorans TaxID=162209 RepID=UPI00088DDB1B|nr:DUF262 domain-containing protein [Paenibacillus naphthalenovorans]SDI55025.1 hypothetical protein SAMN05421868_107209 [Paenibacillus naphthalenovorans]